MSLESTLAAIEKTRIEWTDLASFTRESKHFEVAFNLFREAASYVCVLANICVGPIQAWNVEQAVLGGNLVRMFKLMRFAMEESIEHREEMLSVLVRLLAECVINLRFLVRNSSPELIRSYLLYSLQHEKELAALIKSNIDARAGEVLPIEERMLRSIARTFENSLLKEEELPAKKIRNWGEKNLFEKAKDIGLGDAYLAIFGGPSRNVHGGWQDLLQYHLECESPGIFRPRLEFKNPRPQAIYSLTHLIAETLMEYVELLNHPSLDPVFDVLEDLKERNYAASQAHEGYLVAKMSANRSASPCKAEAESVPPDQNDGGIE
ncbi:hypothetical protein ABF87_03580 [Nitrosomonas sp. JL21]|uniref:DUF5677 domain-containing protein n=1 Tax=Nitrosomonas sp. JL21 TaxID=153949 RepID=UPI00136D29DE|nr:DUF5677 domain-containing protein [Nitrosomonas sp. JL21]MBL8498531.1 hypothetical protein [Nitrosomonas sp.]MCC7092024.1 hypothetical protein [Nitrosomonas sp.]MXS77052.1 hypothetical protein [Nitrosomonas sp. JL21]